MVWNCWWELFCWGGWVKDGFNGCPEWFGIFGTAVDALKIGCCPRFHDQFIGCAACSSVCEAIWFGVRSFPAPLKPAPIFLSFNSFRREPVICLSGPGAVTSFEGSEIIQNRCNCIFHLLFKTIYSGIGVCEERRCQNLLLKRGKVNVFQVSILIRPTRRFLPFGAEVCQ